jgi:hypothetical protein
MNRALQRLCGINDVDLSDFVGSVRATHACFHDKLETVMRTEIGDEPFLRLLDEVKNDYGVSKNKDALKTPIVVADLLRRAAEEGFQSQTLNEIVAAVVRLTGRAAGNATAKDVELAVES